MKASEGRDISHAAISSFCIVPGTEEELNKCVLHFTLFLKVIYTYFTKLRYYRKFRHKAICDIIKYVFEFASP